LQGDILDNDVNKEDDNNDNDNNNDNDDNHFGMEYNATDYDGKEENSVAAGHQARLSASPSSANADASIAPDLSTLSRNGLIAAESITD
jgi:hypothetical protein